MDDAPTLDTPAAWLDYMLASAMTAYDRAHERGEPGSHNDVRRSVFADAARERLAQVAQVVVCELANAREE